MFKISGNREQGFWLKVRTPIFGWKTIAYADTLRDLVKAGKEYSHEELQKSVDNWVKE